MVGYKYANITLSVKKLDRHIHVCKLYEIECLMEKEKDNLLACTSLDILFVICCLKLL
jgi:hypothetical protein